MEFHWISGNGTEHCHSTLVTLETIAAMAVIQLLRREGSTVKLLITCRDETVLI